MSQYTIFWRYISSAKQKQLKTDDIRRCIINATNQWNLINPSLVTLKEGDGEKNIKFYFDKLDKSTKPNKIAECRNLIPSKQWDIVFDVDSKWNTGGLKKILGIGYFLQSTTMHEIGHVFDIDHNDDINSIMYPEYIEHSKLPKQDIINFRTLLE